MREIKFRVWDTFHKQYVSLQDSALFGNIAPRGNELKVICNTELILEQFTGLHDKNGKEIYEGDVVRDEDGDTGQVYYNLDYGYLAIRSIEEEPCEKNLYHLNHTCNLEVIGNIHEKE